MRSVACAVLFLICKVVAAGELAPNFSLPTLANAQSAQVALGDYVGRVIYLDFWAAWCRPCREALPFFAALQAELGGQGFQVIGINIDEDPADGLRFLESYPVNYPVVSDANGAVLTAYKVKTMPTGVLLDRDGRIVMTHRGFRRKHKDKLAERIRRAVAE